MLSKLPCIWPNPPVKGTRRTQALLKVGGLIGFAGFAVVRQPARPLLLRYTFLGNLK